VVVVEVFVKRFG